MQIGMIGLGRMGGGMARRLMAGGHRCVVHGSSRTVLFTLLLLSARTARADDAQAGKPLYTKHCLVCHGMRGKGNGPSGKNLDPKPTDFTTAVANDAEWFKATKLGTKAIGKSKNMDAYGDKLSDQEIRDVLAYVKTFKQP